MGAIKVLCMSFVCICAAKTGNSLQYSAMSTVVCGCCRDVDGEETEAIKPKLMFNPHLQRLYQVFATE